MTVISAIKGKGWGGMVGDTQSSTQLRKSNTTEKIDTFTSNGTRVLVGGSGTSDILYEVITELRHELEGTPYDVRAFKDKLSHHTEKVLRDAVRQRLRSSFNLSEDDVLRGCRVSKGESGVERVEIKPETLSQANQVYLAEHSALEYARHNAFLLIGQDERGVEIYKVGASFRPNQVRRECDSIGSGYDEADKVLTKFMRDLPREERHAIGFITGMYALIKATNEAAEINVGVGGTPVITHFDKEGIHVVGENQSTFASEIVKVAEGNLIERTPAYKALEEILRNPDADYKRIRGRVFGRGTKYRTISEYLAGYK
tara:strand:- start:6058 stop:7002 length:945 start_codon:yes stop_codon:yes gene_type:complete